MEIASKQMWQVAAGDTNRDYINICLDWDVVIVGPGEYGAWPECSSEVAEHYTVNQVTILNRFCEKMQDGDLVVLRFGTWGVFGVGVVVGDYLWSENFGDIDGWDLHHVRRVRWLWDYRQENEGKGKEFEVYTLKLGDSVLPMDSEKVKDWLLTLNFTSEQLERSIKELPPEPTENENDISPDFDEISDFLFDQGIASNSIQDLLSQIHELERIARWYYRTWQKPSESETVAYLVIPILRTLGWTPQKMAVEWNKIDVALFGKTPRDGNNLTAIVEAKKKDSSCIVALPQAKSYADNYEGCRRLIVTDGLRYGVYIYDNEKKEFPLTPNAYLNLVRMRKEYPILRCHGAKEAFFLMAADWNGEVP